MGIRTNIGTSRGTYDEKIDGTTNEVVIESAPGGTSGMLVSDSSGRVSASYLASRVRYEFWDHSGSQPVPTGSYSVIKVNGMWDSVAGGLTTWNTQSNKFQPEAIGNVYTLRLSGKLTNPGKNGTLHIDFALSGATPPLFVQDYNRQKQGYEFNIRNQEDHVHFVVLHTLFTDSVLHLSGGQFYMSTDVNGGIAMASASLFIKEG